MPSSLIDSGGLGVLGSTGPCEGEREHLKSLNNAISSCHRHFPFPSVPCPPIFLVPPSSFSLLTQLRRTGTSPISLHNLRCVSYVTACLAHGNSSMEMSDSSDQYVCIYILSAIWRCSSNFRLSVDNISSALSITRVALRRAFCSYCL